MATCRSDVMGIRRSNLPIGNQPEIPLTTISPPVGVPEIADQFTETTPQLTEFAYRGQSIPAVVGFVVVTGIVIVGFASLAGCFSPAGCSL